MCRGLYVWDYTYAALANAQLFAADDLVPPRLRSAPIWFWRGLTPVIPTFIWVGSPSVQPPQGPVLSIGPSKI
jgi:hypothetical protein